MGRPNQTLLGHSIGVVRIRIDYRIDANHRVSYCRPSGRIGIVADIFYFFFKFDRLCVCCCRCAGACGGRSQPFDKKHDTCRRVFLGLFLILAATGLV